MQTILLPTTRATVPLPFTVVHTAAPNLTRRISPPNRRLSPSFSVSCATFPTPLSPLSANAMTSPLRLLPKTASFVTCASGGFYSPANESEQAKLAQKSAVARAYEDFMPREPTFQTVHIAGSLTVVPKTGKVDVSLGTLTCEVDVSLGTLTVSPVMVFDDAVHFSPIGLLDMYNSGGALDTLETSEAQNGTTVKIKARGCCRFGAYSSIKPQHCTVDATEEEFIYSSEDGLLTVNLEGGCQLKDIEFVY